MKYKKLNSIELIAQRDKHFDTLQGIYNNIKPANLFSIDGFVDSGTIDPYKEPESWVKENLKILERNADLIMDNDVFRPICIEFGLYGVHFIDKIFNANVYYQYGQWYNEYLDSPIGQLEKPDIDNDETWKLSKKIVKTFIDSHVKLPLFGLPTIASTINIAVNLYGQNILMEMLINPQNAVHDFNIINDLLCDIHRFYIDQIPFNQLQPVISWERTQPPGYGQLCGCSNQLLSPGLYKELIAPLDEKLLSVYPNGGMMHLCGSHTQHIKTFREMKSLKALQLNDRAALDLGIYYNELRDDQILYLTCCDEMSIEKALDITHGERLVIQGAID